MITRMLISNNLVKSHLCLRKDSHVYRKLYPNFLVTSHEYQRHIRNMFDTESVLVIKLTYYFNQEKFDYRYTLYLE